MEKHVTSERLALSTNSTSKNKNEEQLVGLHLEIGTHESATRILREDRHFRNAGVRKRSANTRIPKSWNMTAVYLLVLTGSVGVW